MKFPICATEQYIKNGFINKRKAYKCKNGNFQLYNFIKKTSNKLALKRFDFTLYGEILGFNAMGGVLKVSYVSVLN